jgi:zinc transporter ZupT
MCFLFQALLFLGASGTAWVIHRVLGAPLWVGGASGVAFLVAAWIGYLVYQERHPERWPPWDNGLPQQMRMLNGFVPTVMVFLAAIVLLPTFQEARDKALRQQHRLQNKVRVVSATPGSTVRPPPL